MTRPTTDPSGHAERAEAEGPRPSEPAELSVVIVNWNAREDLARCLRALSAAHAGLPAEVLVVDNQSSDGSLEMVDTEFPRVRGLASGANRGFAGGINFGLRHVRGRWIAVLNPDVVPAERSLRTLVAVLDGGSLRALAGPRVLDGKERPIVQDFSLPGPRAALRRLPGVPAVLRGLRRIFGRHDPQGPRRVERVNGCCMVFRREALEAIGGFPEATFLYGEEIAVGGALRDAGFEVWYQPEAEVVHRDGASVEQLWTAGEKLLVFRAARLLTGHALMSRPAFGLWVLILLVGEALYGALSPLARALGRPWTRVSRWESLSLHLLAVRVAVQPSWIDRLEARYRHYAEVRRAPRSEGEAR